jgi:hypothetical protein
MGSPLAPAACATASVTDWIGLVGAAAGLAAILFEACRYLLESRVKLNVQSWLVYTENATGQRGWEIVIQFTNTSRTTALVDSAAVTGVILSDDPLRDAVEAHRQRNDPRLQGLRDPHRRLSDETIHLQGGDAKESRIPLHGFDITKIKRISGEYWGATIRLRDGREWVVDGDRIMQRTRALPNWMLRVLPRRLRLRRWYLDQGWPDEPLRTIRYPQRSVLNAAEFNSKGSAARP